MSSDGRIAVEVAYARPGDQRLVTLRLDDGATIADAVRASGLADVFPEIDPGSTPAGIFGRRYPPTHRLRTGDRVEIYRPLQADPKARRRARAKTPLGTDI